MIKNFNDHIKESIFSFKEGDLVVVNHNLMKYIKNDEDWEGMDMFIGNVFEIERVYYDQIYLKPNLNFPEIEDYWFPRDCLTSYEEDKQIKIKWYKKGKLIEESV